VNESISLLIRSEQPKDTQSNEISESIFQTDFFDIRVEYSLYLFSKENSFRKFCSYLTLNKWFKSILSFFVALNCITLAMERPSIAPTSLVSILN
jgi:voltage-dependent calcium channel T type alpha-1G